MSVIKLLDGTYRAEINGETWSGITPESRFWPDVQAAIEAGDVTEEAAPPAPVVSVTLIRFRTALRRLGHFAGAHAAVQAAGGEAYEIWEYGDQISAASPVVAPIVEALSLTPEQVNNVFATAVGIQF